MTENIYATTVAIEDKGVLIIGKSGAGKSDLALRLIMNKNATLIADDRTDIENIDEKIICSCPKNIQGKLEVRGIGIIDFPFLSSVELKLVVQLVSDYTEIERLPLPEYKDILGVKIPLIKIHPFSLSAVEKVVLSCCKNNQLLAN
ncbi:MAG: HPr kinase/phosphatase C-terminal domain-containing protein [Alphaproteobacteria bacterium]|nr:HPr kinase/phosphatase C-terminal domain-containing protein [Alphaproteobacteria bacterium]